MHAFSSPRLTRAAIGLAAVSAFAVAPMAAQAAITSGTTAQATLNGGAMTISAPVITALSATLSGLTVSPTTPVQSWNVTDATGSDLGWNVTVSATDPVTVDIPAHGTAPVIPDNPSHPMSPNAGHPLSLTAGPATPTSSGNLATAPVSDTIQPLIPTTGATIAQTALAAQGEGSWDFAGTTPIPQVLTTVVPADATAGVYTSSLTFTVAPGV
jgi:hypothetical protein